MKKISQWNGKQEDDIEIEYELETGLSVAENSADQISAQLPVTYYDEPDKTDYLVAAACGILTGLLDSFWVGEFSLKNAQTWGRSNINDFVIKVAQSRGYKKDSLEGAIRFLEKDAPMATDKLANEWGGGYYHHFRDFSHHASIIGLVFSLITQFTGVSYGTNTEGMFVNHEVPNDELIGETFEDKIYNGVVLWGLHLVSDMAGSSSSPGKGTGIPGPIMSLLKGLSVLPGIKNIKFSYNNKQIGISAMLSKVFNGTVFEHTRTDDLTHFDLRTELGVYAFSVKQSIPVIINQCVIRAFYFVRRFIIELGRIKVKSIADIKNIMPKRFLPYNNKCITRMSTIASGVFCAIDTSDATIRTIISKPNSKGEFVTRLLLKANFIGICNFVIAIKNDVMMSLKGEYITGSVSEMKTEGTNTAEIETSNDSIVDISVEIDNNRLYENTFYQMYNEVKNNKEKISAAYEVDKGIQKRILRLEDDETEIYDRVARWSHTALMVETEKLIMRLFTLYGVEYYPFEGHEKTSHFMPFYRIVNNQKIAYVFSESIRLNIEWKSIINEYKVDKIIVVAMIELGEDAETRNSIVNLEMRKAQGYVEFIPLSDLFSLISENEYEIYLDYVEQYNSDIKKLIGYRTIITPSESSLLKMKKELEVTLRSYNFDDILRKEGLFTSQIDVIRQHFWEVGKYRAIFGKSSFAESFISSEWYYQTHNVSSALEQTAIIAGYLKSIEQLLYTIIKFSINTGKSIKKIGGDRNEYIDYTSENEALADITLGSLIGYSRHYSELWSVNSYVKNYITNKLNDFRERYRNDHFHKDNIYNSDEINAIRNNTILLLYLLLGAMNILDSDFESIDYKCEEKKVALNEELSYAHFEQWLNRILGGDVLLPESSIIYFSVTSFGSKGKNWRIQFITYKGINNHGLLDIDKIQFPYIGDELEWDYTPVSYEDVEAVRIEMVNQVKLVLKAYLSNGRYAKKLKSYHSISAGWGYDRNPEIIYKRDR